MENSEENMHVVVRGSWSTLLWKVTCPFFTDVPVTTILSSGLNKQEVLRKQSNKHWFLTFVF